MPGSGRKSRDGFAAFAHGIILTKPNPVAMDTSVDQLKPEQRFQMFLDAACDYAIFFMDAHADICEWSSGAEKILGYTEDEAVQMNGRMIFTEEDRASGVPEREMKKAADDGQANDERWHLRKDGSRFFAMGRLVALKDESEHLYGFAKIVRDVTPNKNLAEALHASDEHFRATFAQAPLGMVLTDLSGRIQQVNAAFCRLINYTAEELKGREFISLIAPDDRELARAQLDELLTGESLHTLVEKRLERADGSTIWVQNSGALLRDAEGLPLSFIDLCHDISILKMSAMEMGRLVDQRTSALQDKTRQMEAFCYTIAHDLRAPLRAIAGYAEFLRRDFAAVLPGDGLTYVRKIEASAARLDRLINDLLGYTRVQQVPLIQEDVDLTKIAELVIEHVKRDINVSGLVIELISPLGRVRADSVTLEHVLFNLISNAIKFRRADVPPLIRIYSEETRDRLRVWVEDNGIGIDPRFKDRVFGMFERLHPEKKIPGTGIGLAIVATAMDRFGGSRGVEPNHPAGSRFWIEFPK
jgi:PAS domain S-box-containing protein